MFFYFAQNACQAFISLTGKLNQLLTKKNSNQDMCNSVTSDEQLNLAESSGE